MEQMSSFRDRSALAWPAADCIGVTDTSRIRGAGPSASCVGW